MIRGEQPFIINKRLLKQPFLSNIAKEGSQMEILGRCFGAEPKDLGQEIILSIVVSKYCKTVHDIAIERMSMKKTFLSFFHNQKKENFENIRLL